VPEAYFGLSNALFWLGDLAGTIANCEKAYSSECGWTLQVLQSSPAPP
jgi:hypothetical protein